MKVLRVGRPKGIRQLKAATDRWCRQVVGRDRFAIVSESGGPRGFVPVVHRLRCTRRLGWRGWRERSRTVAIPSSTSVSLRLPATVTLRLLSVRRLPRVIVGAMRRSRIVVGGGAPVRARVRSHAGRASVVARLVRVVHDFRALLGQ